jgi:hypothetical protein
MTDGDAFRGVVIGKYGVALEVAKELRRLHEELTARLQDAVEATAGIRKLRQVAEDNGGAVSPWLEPRQPIAVPIWEALFPREHLGKTFDEAFASAGVHIGAADGHLALTPLVRMNQKVRLISARRVREEIGPLPQGDTEGWLARGVIAQPMRIDGAGVERSLDRLTDQAVAQVDEYLEFAARVYRATVEEIRSAS